MRIPQRATPILMWMSRLYLSYLLLSASLGGWVWHQGHWKFAPGKLFDPILFTAQVRALDSVPDPWNAWIAMALPWIEGFTGVALLLPWTALGAALMATALMGLFVVTLTSALLRNIEATCGCFGGIGTDPLTPSAVGWRVLWLSLAVLLSRHLWARHPRRVPHENASIPPEPQAS